MSYAKLTTSSHRARELDEVTVYPENLSARLADYNNNSYEALLALGYEPTGPLVLDEASGELVYRVELIVDAGAGS